MAIGPIDKSVAVNLEVARLEEEFDKYLIDHLTYFDTKRFENGFSLTISAKASPDWLDEEIEIELPKRYMDAGWRRAKFDAQAVRLTLSM
jgi:hypothetical protein